MPAIAVSTSVYATTYLTVEQAQQAIFPGSVLTQSFVTLSSEQKQEIEQRTGLTVRTPVIKLWKAPDGGLFIVDDVVGKHELITYALGLNADGSVKAIEIMDYRE
ncbi:MAG: FMN-binding protein, partial [Betaproteobacteria bacterium]